MVTVKIYEKEEKPTDDFDDLVARAHAKLGMPVYVRVSRGGASHSFHLTLTEGAQLAEKLKQATRQ